MDDTRFLKRHRADSWFWGLLWLYVMMVVIVGFEPPVRRRFFDEVQEPASWALVIHVWSYSAWLCLLAIQAYLAGTKRLQLHRTFGLAMLPLAAVMIWSGMASELAFQARRLADGRSAADFFAVSSTYIATFTVLVPLAWMARRRAAAHKRLILMATAAILGGAHLRIWGGWWPEAWFDVYAFRVFYFFGGSMIIVAMGMAYDLATRRALHPVYKIGAPALLAVYALAIVAFDSPRWAALVEPYLR